MDKTCQSTLEQLLRCDLYTRLLAFSITFWILKIPTSQQAPPLPVASPSLQHADTRSASACRQMSMHPGGPGSPTLLSPQQPLTAVVPYRARKQPSRMLLKETGARRDSGFTRNPFPKQVIYVFK